MSPPQVFRSFGWCAAGINEGRRKSVCLCKQQTGMLRTVVFKYVIMTALTYFTIEKFQIWL